jgi:hypothetical protein
MMSLLQEVMRAHGTPDPDVPKGPPPQPRPDPDDVPAPARAPVQEPDAPEPPVKAARRFPALS